MMPAAQTQRFTHVLGSDDVQLSLIPRAGHFVGTDNPKFVADTIINFICRVKGKKAMADIYLGSEGIWKGFHHLWTGEIPRAAGGAALIGTGINREQSDHPPYAPGTCRTKLGHDPASRLQLDGFNGFLFRSEG